MEAEVKKYKKFLGYFHKTHQNMQEKLIKLADCRNELDGWVEKARVHGEQNSDDPEDLFSKLDLKYIKEDSVSAIVKYRDFETGVVKIQLGKSVELNEDEKVAVSSLRVDNPGNVDAADVPQHDPDPNNLLYMSPSAIAKGREAKRQRRLVSVGQESYINCDYILGSVAEVERLWSLARYVLQDHRSSTSPMNLEALLFLKVNNVFWDVDTVNQACKNLGIH